MSPENDQTFTMDPMLPDLQRGDLAELCQEVTLITGELNGLLPSPVVQAQVARLVRGMNCYYSNLIEGHKTLPRDIEAAEQQDFSDQPEERDKLLLARAHIHTEEAMLLRLQQADTEVYSPDFICWIHETFYQQLPESMRMAKTVSGQSYPIIPGKFRDFMVDMGTHTRPESKILPDFLQRFQTAYGRDDVPATQRLIAIAAAHHRLAWIHPFGDSNGRVIRLHSHALLRHHYLGGHGLWTLSRGLARSRQTYYARLAAADRPRENDWDGRGPLSAKGLTDWCTYFLETMIDQAGFMRDLLRLHELRTRIEDYFRFKASHLKKHREDLMQVVSVLAYEGELPRERVQAITGKGATTAAAIIKLGLAEGYIHTPSPKGVLQIAFPTHVLPYYFPGLFIDLPEEG
ncbi:MAG: Fic family protein [Candidatus Omnitrophota bacterium]|jgi:Fic family protein